ncbi:glutamate-1-semialdehyde 2,1-aminomutase [Oxyplasma meridianum]|uniref:Glutamate-1-semialdehyde 2,1-aminomutase n=1 Tax=Oxyplasma meridianum TaxID=3073602 RepID=A0AAX4NHS5_9ARCH
MNSKELFSQSSRLFPGGVNSPVRYYDPYPVFMKKGEGSRIYDVDDKSYTDFCLAFGPLILGHSHSEVIKAVRSAVENATSLGAPTENEIKLGNIIQTAVPSVEKMRFTNSGTEATMHALRLARGFTGRNIILKMEGGFHGSHDYALIKSGSGTLTFGVPSSRGIPEEVSRTVVVGQYNNPQSIEEIFKKYGKDIAAVITEPIMGNAGVIKPEKDFLGFLRDITSRNDSLLIFDEVITGFRFGFRCFQDIAGVKPDLTTMGKIIGGGFPIGLFGGRDDIMDKISPVGPVYESGTFSGNYVTMAAGIAALNQLRKMDYSSLEAKSSFFENTLAENMPEKEKFAVSRFGSMFQIFLGIDHPVSYEEVIKADSGKFMRMFHKLLERGVYLAPGQFETNFISFAHSKEELETSALKISETLKETGKA